MPIRDLPDGIHHYRHGDALHEEVVSSGVFGGTPAEDWDGFVAVRGGQVVGFATHLIHPDDGVGIINDIWVDGDFRRQEIATAMVREAKRRFPDTAEFGGPWTDDGAAFVKSVEGILNGEGS